MPRQALAASIFKGEKGGSVTAPFSRSELVQSALSPSPVIIPPSLYCILDSVVLVFNLVGLCFILF